VASVERKCDQILHRQHLRQLVQTTVTQNSAGVPQLDYQADATAQQELADTPVPRLILGLP
jgi:hypothetical protein